MQQHPDTCAACEKKFTPSDDIVICPDCGAPYHRACYQQNGQCLYSEKHGTGYEYTDPHAKKTPEASGQNGHVADDTTNSSAVVRCPACGTVNTPQNIFCKKCGTPLHGKAPQNGPGWQSVSFEGLGEGPISIFSGSEEVKGDIDGIPVKDWMTYIGPRAPSYLYRFSVQKKRGTKTGSILSAFFLGPYYFAYRKMWGLAAITFVLWNLFSVPTFLQMLAFADSPLVASFSLSTLDTIAQVVWVVNIVSRLLISLFAVYFYRKSGARQIKALQKKYPDEISYQAALAKAGGPSMPGLLAVVILQVVLVSILPAVLGIDLSTIVSNLLY